jgi:16S rRNA (guanine(1405)-N(7))-methyltransferase
VKPMAESAELERVVETVQASVKYSRIHPEFVRRVAAQELEKSRKPKETIKAIKNKLHQVAGAYLEGKLDPTGWLADLQQASETGGPKELQSACQKIMQQHASTRERLPILDDFYSAIFTHLPPIHSVLDLACGLNPLAIPWMPLTPDAAYHACDISRDITAFLDEALALLRVEGKAWDCDLLGEPPTQKVDLALLLKTLPVLEQVEKGSGARLLHSVKADYLLVSYPLRSLGGRDVGMAETYAADFMKIVEMGAWRVDRFEYRNEIAFLLSH